jgi:hypothetical protein
MTTTPASEVIKRASAIFSVVLSRSRFWVRMDIKEDMQANASSNAIKDANSSTMVDFAVSVMWNDVITIRQKPRRFVAVPSMCGDVLLAMR